MNSKKLKGDCLKIKIISIDIRLQAVSDERHGTYLQTIVRLYACRNRMDIKRSLIGRCYKESMRIFWDRVLSHIVGSSFHEILGKIFMKTNIFYEQTMKIYLLPSVSVKLSVIFVSYVFGGIILKRKVL